VLQPAYSTRADPTRGLQHRATDTITGLVLTLDASTCDVTALLGELRRHDSLCVGQPEGPWLPVTAETDDPRALHRWLESLPGVRAVDVVFVEVVGDENFGSEFAVPPSGGTAAPPEGGTTNPDPAQCRPDSFTP